MGAANLIPHLRDIWLLLCALSRLHCAYMKLTSAYSAVYFNPAKTLGGMLEADKYCLMGLLFAAFVSLSSMSMFWFFEVRAGWEWLADALVILWIGVGMSLVAWMKLWMAKPTFNTGLSAPQRAPLLKSTDPYPSL